MKLPQYNGGNTGAYLSSLVCFVVGMSFLGIVSLGRLSYDEDAIFFSKLPNGKIGVGEIPADLIGFILIIASCLIFFQVVRAIT